MKTGIYIGPVSGTNHGQTEKRRSDRRPPAGRFTDGSGRREMDDAGGDDACRHRDDPAPQSVPRKEAGHDRKAGNNEGRLGKGRNHRLLPMTG